MLVALIVIETLLVVVAQLMLRHGALKLEMSMLSSGASWRQFKRCCPSSS